MKNGVPFDVAMRLDDNDRAAWSIMFMEFRGLKFNFATMDFEDAK